MHSSSAIKPRGKPIELQYVMSCRKVAKNKEHPAESRERLNISHYLPITDRHSELSFD